ncbi:hypothetical protein Tco_0842426 [Tanacetum coccineum]|uniref:Uncharacterized protein n=1 Tax=Tanacetum coccineum TaxID=301880 RepID=A0ABQ5B3K3_9ASTR
MLGEMWDCQLGNLTAGKGSGGGGRNIFTRENFIEGYFSFVRISPLVKFFVAIDVLFLVAFYLSLVAISSLVKRIYPLGSSISAHWTRMASESDSSQPLPKVSDVKTPTSTATEQLLPFFSLESHKVTVYPGRNVADILIVISNFSIPTGLRVAEASLLKQQLEIRKEEDDVKPSSLSKDSYAVYPYSIPKSWEIQSFVDKTLDLPNFSAE